MDYTLWGIHGGRTGDADTLFLKRGAIALGWHAVPDLSGLPDDREAFKALIAETYPDNTPTQVANNAGQLYRFVHEMRTGDLVAYPSKRDRRIHVGRVTGGTGTRRSPSRGTPTTGRSSGSAASRGRGSRRVRFTRSGAP